MTKYPKKKTNNSHIINISPKPKLIWSEYQKNVFRSIAKDTGNLMIIARAGASKTTVLVEGSKYLPKGGRSLFCAFSKAIQEELRSRIPQSIEVRTIHSLGFSAIRARFGNDVKLNNNKCWEIVEELVGNIKENYDLIDNICKTVSFCKATLTDAPSKIDELIPEYGIDLCDTNSEQFIKYVVQALRKCKEKTNEIDYDDMVWMAFVYNLNIGSYDNIMIDECQDLNKVQIELVMSAVKKPDGRVIAVLDDRQCVDENTKITTNGDNKIIKDLIVGDEILSYENGKFVFNKVLNKVKSECKDGIKIITKNGNELLMSPEHKIWAEPQKLNNKFIVYLMYRSDLGFRVGKTNKWKDGSNGFGSRAIHEQADKLWVLDIISTNEEAIYIEECYSLKFGIPTSVFEGGKRGLNQNRINNIFDNFGQNGINCLIDKNLSFDYPHWMARSATTSSKKRLVIRISAHGNKNTSVNLEFSDNETLKSIKLAGYIYNTYKRRAGDLEHKVIRRWFSKYTDAAIFAEKLSKITGALITENFTYKKESDFRLNVAASLFKGMKVLIENNNELIDDEIIKIEKCKGNFYDIEVENTANFVGNNILSHNCIFGWRGADTRVLENLRTRLKPKELMLPICYRCPTKVIDLVQKIVPDIVARPGAPEGSVINLDLNELQKTAKPGDYVISRFNAPLIKSCMRFLKAGIPANILGRDIGEGLIYLIKKSKKKKVVELLQWLSKWEKQEKERLISKYPKANTENITDRAECIRMLCEDVNSIEEVKINCKNLFQDGDEKKIVLHASVHRVKGKEQNNVFVLADTLRETSEEEINIKYVAFSRAKEKLYLVRKPSKYAQYDEDPSILIEEEIFQ